MNWLKAHSHIWAGGLGWTTSYSEAAELRALFTLRCMWEVLKARFSWHGWDPLTHLEVEADANKHRAIIGDHNRCTSADEPDRTPTWNSSTEHQTNTSLAESNSKKRRSVSFGPVLNLQFSLITVTKSQDENLFNCVTVSFSHKINFHSWEFLQSYN